MTTETTLTILCPRCHSQDVAQVRGGRLNTQGNYQCGQCKIVFRLDVRLPNRLGVAPDDRQAHRVDPRWARPQ